MKQLATAILFLLALLSCAPTPAQDVFPIKSAAHKTVAPSYQGECDVIAAGCAAAYNVQRAMTVNYSGNLFQITNTNNSATTNVGQTAGHVANPPSASSMGCGSGTTTDGITSYPDCKVSIIYEEIQGSANNAVPISVNHGSFNCAAGGLTCACPYQVEVATGLPIMQTSSTCGYFLASDAAMTGVTGGTASISEVYDGVEPGTTACCFQAGASHLYSATDTVGTDFGSSVFYGQGSTGVDNLCPASVVFCAGIEEESAYDVEEYSATGLGSVVQTSVYNSSTSKVTAYINGGLLFGPISPASSLLGSGQNTGTRFHLGGGGDLSTPAVAIMRGVAFVNGAMSATDDTSVYGNVTSFYSGSVSYTNYTPPTTAVTVVQSVDAQNGSSGATSKTVTFGSATGTSKHGVVVGIFWAGGASSDAFSGGSVTHGSDTCSEVANSYTSGGSSNPSWGGEVWVCANIGSTSTSVTVTTNGASVDYLGVLADEINCPTSGCAADQGGAGTTAAPMVTCNLATHSTTAKSGEFFYALGSLSQAIQKAGRNASMNTNLTNAQDEWKATGPSGSTYGQSWIFKGASAGGLCSGATIEP